MQLPKLKLLIEALLIEQLSPQENASLLKFARAHQQKVGASQPEAARKLEPLIKSAEKGAFRFDIVKNDDYLSELFGNLEVWAGRAGGLGPTELRDLTKIKDKYFSWYGGSIFKSEDQEDGTSEGREEQNLQRTWNRVWKGRQG